MAKGFKHFSDRGAQDIVELTRSQSRVGKEEPWTSCCVIIFPDMEDVLTSNDRAIIKQVIPHLTNNPLPQTAVDGFRDPNNQDLSDLRSKAVCSALVDAGVMPHRISIGAFGDPLLSCMGRVEVLSRYHFEQ